MADMPAYIALWLKRYRNLAIDKWHWELFAVRDGIILLGFLTVRVLIVIKANKYLRVRPAKYEMPSNIMAPPRLDLRDCDQN